MKAKLIFNLPDDNKDHLQAVMSSDAFSFMWDFQQYLRGQWKYADTPDDIEKIYNKWFEMLNNNNINLDNLIE